MQRLTYILLFLFSLQIFSSCVTLSKKREVYRGGKQKIPSHRDYSGLGKKIGKLLGKERNAFGNAPSGAKFSSAYPSSLKKQQRAFGSGMTRGKSNALPSDRHSQGLGKGKNFKFLFPGHPKYYRGHRTKLGLFKMN